MADINWGEAEVGSVMGDLATKGGAYMQAAVPPPATFTEAAPVQAAYDAKVTEWTTRETNVIAVLNAVPLTLQSIFESFRVLDADHAEAAAAAAAPAGGGTGGPGGMVR